MRKFDMGLIGGLTEVILENNIFETLSGERFKELYGIDYRGAISFAAHSCDHKSWKTRNNQWVTHLLVDAHGNIRVVVSDSPIDDLSLILGETRPIHDFLWDDWKEWLNLLN